MGVDPTASADQIRTAYRAAARWAHPDRSASSATRDASDATMADINEAYRVLGHPARRASYDEGLRIGASAAGGTRTTNTSEAVPDRPLPVARGWLARLLSPPGPARYPVRLVLVAAVVSSVAMLLYSSRSGVTTDRSVDGVIETGSCATLDPRDQVTETPCEQPDAEFVVIALVRPGQTCPDGRPGYIDRNGLSVVCLENRGPTP